ncbi:MAG: sigma-54 dependent transcriptional regulator [Planctomycetota bacterium]|nr:sigma-54 dependent transcriptional regulator [Planctomycetota bacterium]
MPFKEGKGEEHLLDAMEGLRLSRHASRNPYGIWEVDAATSSFLGRVCLTSLEVLRFQVAEVFLRIPDPSYLREYPYKDTIHYVAGAYIPRSSLEQGNEKAYRMVRGTCRQLPRAIARSLSGEPFGRLGQRLEEFLAPDEAGRFGRKTSDYIQYVIEETLLAQALQKGESRELFQWLDEIGALPVKEFADAARRVKPRGKTRVPVAADHPDVKKIRTLAQGAISRLRTWLREKGGSLDDVPVGVARFLFSFQLHHYPTWISSASVEPARRPRLVVIEDIEKAILEAPSPWQSPNPLALRAYEWAFEEILMEGKLQSMMVFPIGIASAGESGASGEQFFLAGIGRLMNAYDIRDGKAKLLETLPEAARNAGRIVAARVQEKLAGMALGGDRLREETPPSAAPAARVEVSEVARDGTRPIIGASEGIQEVLVQAGRVAPSPVTVLILGESGVGKELVARAIHEQSPRRDGPFVTVDCGSIPQELIESELFGHVKGSFTGATADRRGKFERAIGGTIFLDEVGEMSPSAQLRLLRVLQEREIEKVGGKGPIPVNVRVVAATKKDLWKEVGRGEFRDDLFFRLHAVPIHVPPLRRRPDDIPHLVRHFLDASGKRHSRETKGISEDALEAILKHDWPGNVRQLENFIDRLVVMAEDRSVYLDQQVLPELEKEPGAMPSVS